MSKKLSTPIIIVAVLAILCLWAVSGYNKLVRLNEGCSSQWSKVESAYQRRMDLIPNLVSVVKGYAKHEESTLLKVVEARSNAASVPSGEENAKAYQQAQAQLTSAMRDVNVVVERYPDLKANQNFLELQSQLEGTENRINVERVAYAEQVKAYNSKRNMFPTNILANIFGFKAKEYFTSDQGSEKAPKVSFE
jgi:LemA protein